VRRNNIKTKVYRINLQRTMKIDKCYRCSMKGHLSCTCLTPKHLIDLYQASIKDKEKYIKMNFANHNNHVVIYICFHYVMLSILIVFVILFLKFNIYFIYIWRYGHTDGMINFKMIGEDLCLADSCTTHTILRDKKYFQYLILNKASVNTISGSSNLIEGSGIANIILPKGTKFCIDDALYSFKSRRNLINFKDIRLNGYHVETTNEGSDKYLYITSIISSQKLILKKLSAFSSGLYYTTIRTIESHVVKHQKCSNPKMFML